MENSTSEATDMRSGERNLLSYYRAIALRNSDFVLHDLSVAGAEQREAPVRPDE
jgi:hypothetical protein